MPPPLWLYVPVMTGLLVANIACAAWWLRYRQRQDVLWWAGAALVGTTSATTGLLSYAPFPSLWEAIRVSARGFANGMEIVLAAGLVLTLIVMAVRRRPFMSSEGDNLPPEIRGLTLCAVYLSVVLSGKQAESPLGLMLMVLSGFLLPLIVVVAWDVMRRKNGSGGHR